LTFAPYKNIGLNDMFTPKVIQIDFIYTIICKVAIHEMHIMLFNLIVIVILNWKSKWRFIHGRSWRLWGCMKGKHKWETRSWDWLEAIPKGLEYTFNNFLTKYEMNYARRNLNHNKHNHMSTQKIITFFCTWWDPL